MKKIGNILIFFSVIATISLWLLSKQELSGILESPFRSLGQIAGLLAALFVCTEFILATRMRMLETFFGGLDKVYKTHAVTGALAFLFMLNHPVLLAVNVLPSVPAATGYFYPSPQNLPYAYGILGLYLIIMLLVATLFLRLPYHIWKKTHIFMVIPQMFIIAHVIFISSDTSKYMPLRYWILSLGFLSIIAYVYKRFFYAHFGHRYFYYIQAVKHFPDITELTLKAEGKIMVFEPGQFVFISIQNKAIGLEDHPFSVSSEPEEETLRLTIKHTGDYTDRLVLAKPGMKVKLYGPYGRFGEESLVKNSDEIWIAGGIGVTPFMSLLRYYVRNAPNKNIWFFYSTKQEKDAAYLEEINSLVRQQPRIRFLHCVAEKGERITAGLVGKTIGGFSNRQIMLCGPGVMVEDLWEQFVSLGVKPGNLIFEEFNFLP